MADYRPNSNGLSDFLKASQMANESLSSLGDQGLKQLLQKRQEAAEAAKQQAGFNQERAVQAQSISEAERLSKSHPGMGIEVSKEGAGLKPNPVLATYDLKKDQFDQKQANLYSKGLEKYSDLTGAARDLERITNRDGQGGVFSNPKAQLVSGGKMVSAMPDAALGLGELLKLAPSGSAEERKALARYKLAMGHALTGARMNPTMQKMIQDSLGGMASGDPALMAKGLRGSARIIGGTVKTVQGGFSPEVRGTVHEQMGGDPLELFGRIPSEEGPPSNYTAPPAGSGNQPQPQAPQAKSGIPSFEEWKKMKASGQIR